MTEQTPPIPRDPFEFDADGFEVGRYYKLTRKINGYKFTYHRCVGIYFEDGGGYKHIRFDVSKACVTWELLA